jgi:hypothetical protein
MTLSKTQKIILGIFTFLPFVLFPFILWHIAYAILELVEISDHGEPEDREILVIVFSFIVPIILLALSSLVLLIFYIVHAILNKTIGTGEQLLWILLFIFLGIVAFPVYWVMRIWNNTNKS